MNKKIVDYYQQSQWLYRLFVYNPQTLGMHYGLWDKKTKNIQQAILNTNQAVIDLAKISHNQKILDAGCGVGGTAIYIAEKTGAKVYGITLDPNQVRLAKKYSEKHKVPHLTDFSQQDFTKTKFPNKFFDVVYGIESICYSSPKIKFLKEAFRILKPEGTLIIIDGYCSRIPNNNREKNIIEDFKKAFVLQELITPKILTEQIKKAGFKNIRVLNKTKEVEKPVKYYSKMAKILLPIAKLFSLLPFPKLQSSYRNSIAVTLAQKAYSINLASYYIHLANTGF